MMPMNDTGPAGGPGFALTLAARQHQTEVNENGVKAQRSDLPSRCPAGTPLDPLFSGLSVAHVWRSLKNRNGRFSS
jgi:hypothetical protein